MNTTPDTLIVQMAKVAGYVKYEPGQDVIPPDDKQEWWYHSSAPHCDWFNSAEECVKDYKAKNAKYQVHERKLDRATQVTVGTNPTGETLEAGTIVYAVVYMPTSEEFTYAYVHRDMAQYIADRYTCSPPDRAANFGSQFYMVSGRTVER